MILIDTLIHAREWLTGATALKMIDNVSITALKMIDNVSISEFAVATLCINRSVKLSDFTLLHAW